MKYRFFLLWCFVGATFSLLQATPVTAVEKKENMISDISFERGDNGVETVTFKMKEKASPTMFQLSGKNPRVVFDFFDTVAVPDVIKNSVETGDGIIKKIRVGSHAAPASKIRVVFDVAENKSAYDVTSIYQESTRCFVVRVARKNIQHIKQTAKKKIIIHDKTIQKTAIRAESAAPPKVVESSIKSETSGQRRERVKRNIATVQTVLINGGKSATPIDKKDPSGLDETENRAADLRAKDTTEPFVREKRITEQVIDDDATFRRDDTRQNEETAEDRESEVESQNAGGEKKKTTPVIRKVSFEKSSENKEMVFFYLNEFFPPMVFAADEKKLQVVCEFFDGTFEGEGQKIFNTTGDYITRVKIETFDTPTKVRVIMDLTPNYNYDLKQVFFRENNVFVIIISNLGEKK